MKAIVFEKAGGPEVLALAEVPKPDVRPGMVLIRNHAIGANFADTRFRQAHRYLESRQSMGKLILIP